MPRHARPPQDDLPPNTVEADVTPEQAARARRGRRPRVLLPDDDPFVLIGMVDETGGVRGDTKAMTHTQAKAFRRFCLLPPTHRSLARLRATLEVEWGKAPNRKSLEKWSSEFGWQKLLKLYDETLDRYHLWKLEQDRLEARRRGANLGRSLMRMGSHALTQDLLGKEEGAEGTAPAINPRTGQPYRKPQRIQGLAFAIKVGFEMERMSLGLPTSISDQRVEANVTNESVSVTMTLDEWRRQSRLARADADHDDAGEGATALRAPRDVPALPPPAADKPWLRHAPADALDEIPADWFDGDVPEPIAPSRVVDADPSPAPPDDGAHGDEGASS